MLDEGGGGVVWSVGMEDTASRSLALAATIRSLTVGIGWHSGDARADS